MDIQESAWIQTDRIIYPESINYKATIIFIHHEKEKHTFDAFAKLLEHWMKKINTCHAKSLLHYIPESLNIESTVEGVQTLIKNEIEAGILSIGVIGFMRGGVAAFFASLNYIQIGGVDSCSTPTREFMGSSLMDTRYKSTKIFSSTLTENFDDLIKLMTRDMEGFLHFSWNCHK